MRNSVAYKPLEELSPLGASCIDKGIRNILITLLSNLIFALKVTFISQRTEIFEFESKLVTNQGKPA